MGFKECLSIISRRWQVFLPMAALVVGAHLLWVFHGQPQLYRASALLAIAPPPGGAGAGGGGVPVTVPITPLNRLEAFFEPAVLHRAADLLTGRSPFQSPLFEAPARSEAILRFTRGFAGELEPGEVHPLLDEIRGAFTASMSREDPVITVEAVSPQPDRALGISWAVAEAARLHHQERCRRAVEGAVGELKAERAGLDREREQVRRERMEFQNRTGFTDLPRYREMVQGTILNIDGDLSTTEGQKREVERQIHQRVGASQRGADEVQAAAEELGESQRLRFMESELVKLGLERDMVALRRTESDPSLAELEARLQRLTTLIQKEREAVAADGLKRWNAHTRDLVQRSAGLGLRIEGLRDRKGLLSAELFRLAEVGEEHRRIEERAAAVETAIERVKGRIQELESAGANALGRVEIHDPGDAPRPVRKRGSGAGPIALTVFLGLAFGLGVAGLLECVDTRVKTEHQVSRCLGLPLLGVIPRNRHHLLNQGPAGGEIAERFNTAATLVRAAARELGMKTFMVTSAVEREGKTTVAVNLSIALAQKGSRVILVDADLRAPRIHQVLNLPNGSGLTTALGGRLDASRIMGGSLADAERAGEAGDSAAALLETEVMNLSVLTSGPSTDSPAQCLESDRMHRLIKELCADADFVIFDTPPVSRVGDALTVAALVDASVLVVGSGLCDQHEAAWAKHLLQNVQASILGVFLNRCSPRLARGSAYAYYRAASKPRRWEKVLS